MRALLAALVSGILLYLSQGLADVWSLAWIAPAPLLWLAYGDAPRWQVLAGSLAAFALGQTYLMQCYWGQIPPSLIAPLVAAMCVTFAIAVAFSGEAFRRGSPWAALLAFPALWTALEYAIGKVSPHGSFGALGYAEVSFPAGMQLAALFGVHAVTFVLCLCANAVALLLSRQAKAGWAGLAVCAFALVFGLVRLAEVGGPRVPVAALADVDTRNAENHQHTLASEEATAQTYTAYIEGLKGMRVIAIPEGAVQMREGDRQAVLAPLAAAARASGALVLVGTFTPEPAQNRAFAFLPDGAVESYDKRHPLLPFETETPGREPGFLGGGYATQICKDMDFAGTVRGTAALGVRLMIVPADDFVRDDWIHARIAIMRGVENGFAVLRSAFDGLETISDAQGRILASARTTKAGMVAIEADVALGPGPTLYTRIGDVFPWLCAGLSLLIAVWTFAGRKSGATVHANQSLVAVTLALLGLGASSAARSQESALTVTVAGQAMLRSDLRTTDAPALARIRSMLAGDVIFTNLEGTVAEPGQTVHEGRGFLTPPGALDALQAMGFNLLALSDNHAFDLQLTGILNTLREADLRHLAHAGTGLTLAAAAAPAYLSTAHGKVALVASASGLLPAGARALASQPGVNELRIEAGTQPNEASSDLLDAPANHPQPDDARRILGSIQEAHRNADLVIVYQHNHVFGNESFSTLFSEGLPERLRPNAWLIEWVHREIDAGADIVVMHGAPLLHGVEIYHGKPIFYDLGNFIYNVPPVLTYIDEPMAWESVIATVEFAHGKLRSVTFRPVALNTIGTGQPDVHSEYTNNQFLDTRGLPQPATGAKGRYILERLIRLSRPFGTRIEVQGDSAQLTIRPSRSSSRTAVTRPLPRSR